MGKTVSVHLWFDGHYDGGEAAHRFLTAADCLEPITKELEGEAPRRFRTLTVEEHDPLNVVRVVELLSDDVEDVARALGPSPPPEAQFSLESRYELNVYRSNPDRLAPTVRPLDLRLRGPKFGVAQHYPMRLGPLQIDFVHAENLGIPFELVQKTQRAVAAKGDHGRALEMIKTLADGSNRIHDLARRLIDALDPRRLIVCTGDEVHPLTAHGIYHRHLSGFVDDLASIIRVHGQGGYYASEGTRAPEMPPPRSPGHYGIIRLDHGTTDAMMVRVDKLMTVPIERVRRLSADAIRTALDDAADAMVIPSGASVYVASKDGVFGYLEEPYFNLAAMANPDPTAVVH